MGFLGMILKVSGERKEEMKLEGDEVIKRFLLELPATSDIQIAKIVDCDSKEVNRIRKELRDSEELSKREIDDGKLDDI